MKKKTGRSAAYAHSAQGEQGFWSSYADMMSAVALILFFLMLLSYIQNLITGNDLQNTQEVLSDTRAQLALTQTQVEEAEQELLLITTDLENAKQELLRQNQIISDQKATIATQQLLAEEQEKYLASTQEELTELRGQMQNIAVLRLSILEQIKDSIAKVMGDADKVSIGENGSIILSESVLFDYGSSAVKPDSEKMLDQLAKVFTTFLSDSENAKYVDSIVISGHTDNRGTEEMNRTLSTERANSVLNYLLSSGKGELNDYARYFCAAGYGTTRPVADNNTDAGRAANRRIEISIILRDETVLDIVEEYLAIEVPEAPKS